MHGLALAAGRWSGFPYVRSVRTFHPRQSIHFPCEPWLTWCTPCTNYVWLALRGVPVHAYVHAPRMLLSLSISLSLSLSLSPLLRLSVTINHNSPSFPFASTEKSLGGPERSFEEPDGTKRAVFFRRKIISSVSVLRYVSEETRDETRSNYEYEISSAVRARFDVTANR